MIPYPQFNKSRGSDIAHTLRKKLNRYFCRSRLKRRTTLFLYGAPFLRGGSRSNFLTDAGYRPRADLMWMCWRVC